MSDDLRRELSIETGLEKVITAALEEKKSIVIAGSAGSGKTHLIRMAGNLGRHHVVPDLAALPQAKWTTLFSSKALVVVAGNEGAFIAGVRKNIPGFSLVIDALHALQNGEDFTGKGPVVIDAAGYDPAGSHAIAKILRLPILQKYVEGKANPLTLAAWKMFEDETVCRRLALLVETASAQSEVDGFTFRQLWQFVSELLEGGTGLSGLWFYRVFNGRSEVAKKISACFSASSLALPHLGNRLWHGDLEAIREHVLDASVPILEYILQPGDRNKSDESRREHLSVLRQFAVFGLKFPMLEERLSRPANLWSQVRKKQHPPLLRAINQYMTYGLLTLGDDLELWTQYDTERRELKPSVQLSLGTAFSDSFELRRSAVIANRPTVCGQVEGGRLVLIHKGSGAALTITKDFVDGMLHGRSHRTKERRGVEYDWRLLRFFSAVAAKVSRPDSLRVALFDFQARSGRMVKWQVKGDKLEKLEV
jgi:hypothetical protein